MNQEMKKVTTVYLTTYNVQNGKSKYETEHETGLFLLVQGLKELFGIFVTQAEVSSMIGYGRYGKPYLKDYENIYYNISHCDDFVACAFADKPIGVDVERIEEFKDIILKRVLDHKEQEFLSQYKKSSLNYKEVFCRFWTLKESYVKQNGQGFHRELTDVTFQMNLENEPAKITCSDEKKYFFQKVLKDKCILSLCSEDKLQLQKINIKWV